MRKHTPSRRVSATQKSSKYLHHILHTYLKKGNATYTERGGKFSESLQITHPLVRAVSCQDIALSQTAKIPTQQQSAGYIYIYVFLGRNPNPKLEIREHKYLPVK